MKLASRQEQSKRDRVEFARLLGVEPDQWQKRFLRSKSKRILLNCSRQSGKSTTTAIRALHEAVHSPGSLSLVLAPAERQAKEFFSKVMDFYRILGYRMTARSERKLGMVLENGSRIEALPGSERTIRGFSGVSLLILDEAARVPDSLYYAVRPMLAVTGGALLMLSTPWGKQGVFYEEWSSTGEWGEAWERYEVSAHACPRIGEDFLAEEKERLPRLVYDQEYLCKFVETDDAVFTSADIEAAMTMDIKPLFETGT